MRIVGRSQKNSDENANAVPMKFKILTGSLRFGIRKDLTTSKAIHVGFLLPVALLSPTMKFRGLTIVSVGALLLGYTSAFVENTEGVISVTQATQAYRNTVDRLSSSSSNMPSGQSAHQQSGASAWMPKPAAHIALSWGYEGSAKESHVVMASRMLGGSAGGGVSAAYPPPARTSTQSTTLGGATSVAGSTQSSQFRSTGESAFGTSTTTGTPAAAGGMGAGSSLGSSTTSGVPDQTGGADSGSSFGVPGSTAEAGTGSSFGVPTASSTAGVGTGSSFGVPTANSTGGGGSGSSFGVPTSPAGGGGSGSSFGVPASSWSPPEN